MALGAISAATSASKASEATAGTEQNCNTGETNEGKSWVGYLANAAAIAAAVLQTNAALKIADQQYDIAKRSYNIAKWWRDYYNNNYRPIENQELAEAKALKPYDPIYDTTIGRHRLFAKLQLKQSLRDALSCTGAYCTGVRSALITDHLTGLAAAQAGLSNLGYRNERAYKEARDDNRWQRIEAVVNRGRNLPAKNASFMALSTGIYGSLRQQATVGAAGAIRFLGYRWNRNNTQYPMLGVVPGGQQAPQRESVGITVTDISDPVPQRQVTSGYDVQAGRMLTQEEMDNL